MSVQLARRALMQLQTTVPWSRPVKFNTYNALTRSFGVHVEPEFRLLADLGTIDLAVDIGANWGQSIEALRYYSKAKAILAFEPDAALAERLKARYRGIETVRIENAGLGQGEEEKILYVPAYRKFVFDGLASFDRQEAREFINRDRMLGFVESKLEVREQPARLKRLDSFNLNPDVVKIDVQGFEYNVLVGGSETFRRNRPFTIVENPTASVVEFFKQLDMLPYVLTGRTLHPSTTSGDNTIFMTREHCATLTAGKRWQVTN